MQPDPMDQAYQHFEAGRLPEAAEQCRAILAQNPGHVEANHFLGLISFQQGKIEEALSFLERATESPMATPDMLNNLGAVLNRHGRNKESIAAYQRSLAVNPDYADALNNIGVAYRDENELEKAIAAFRRAIELDPSLIAAKSNLRSAYRDVVPAWHFAMMDDAQRNEAYEAAIRRAAPGKRVLDIGTGAGLLAMMAARAGAASVTTCETVGLIAEGARAIIARNGLSSHIDVIGKASTSLVVGHDLKDRAEVLVTETFASGLIGEGIVPTMEHAHEHLLTPGGTIIPAAGSIMGYLAGGDVLKGMLFADRIAGFDVSPFNDFAPPMLVASLNGLPHQALSDDAELMRFDFRERNFPMTGRRIELKATQAGVCVGVAQWIRLELDSEIRYENRPSKEAAFNGHWTHILHRFPRLVEVAPGDVVPILIKHDRSQINIDLAE